MPSVETYIQEEHNIGSYKNKMMLKTRVNGGIQQITGVGGHCPTLF